MASTCPAAAASRKLRLASVQAFAPHPTWSPHHYPLPQPLGGLLFILQSPNSGRCWLMLLGQSCTCASTSARRPPRGTCWPPGSALGQTEGPREASARELTVLSRSRREARMCPCAPRPVQTQPGFCAPGAPRCGPGSTPTLGDPSLGICAPCVGGTCRPPPPSPPSPRPASSLWHSKHKQALSSLISRSLSASLSGTQTPWPGPDVCVPMAQGSAWYPGLAPLVTPASSMGTRAHPGCSTSGPAPC